MPRGKRHSLCYVKTSKIWTFINKKVFVLCFWAYHQNFEDVDSFGCDIVSLLCDILWWWRSMQASLLHNKHNLFVTQNKRVYVWYQIHVESQIGKDWWLLACLHAKESMTTSFSFQILLLYIRCGRKLWESSMYKGAYKSLKCSQLYCS